MAKKEETISLIDTFSEFKELKNIDRTTMVSVLEESFRRLVWQLHLVDILAFHGYLADGVMCDIRHIDRFIVNERIYKSLPIKRTAIATL